MVLAMGPTQSDSVRASSAGHSSFNRRCILPAERTSASLCQSIRHRLTTAEADRHLCRARCQPHVFSNLCIESRGRSSCQRTPGPVRVSLSDNPAWPSLSGTTATSKWEHGSSGEHIGAYFTDDEAMVFAMSRACFLRGILSVRTVKRQEAKSHDRASESLRRTVFQKTHPRKSTFSNGVVTPRAENKLQLHQQHFPMSRITPSTQRITRFCMEMDFHVIMSRSKRSSNIEDED